MKKLLATVPLFLLLAACATNSPMSANKAPAQSTQTLTCEDNGQVAATYSANGTVANLNVTLQKAGLNNQKVILNQAVSGSGAHYVNNANPKMSYEWQTKADYGILSVSSTNGQQYSVNCQL